MTHSRKRQKMITHSTFKPARFLSNPHLQTLLANLIHPPFPDVSYETLELPDGDSLDIAWGTAQGPYTVLILHGLEGSLKSAYAQRILNLLNHQKIPAAMMFFRGCNGRPNHKLRSYHSGDTEDLRFVIDSLRQRGFKRIALLGYSLGGNVVLKYLGEAKTTAEICCGVGVSVPMLLADCAARMNQGFSRIYQFELLKRLKHKIAQKENLLKAAGFNTDTRLIQNFEQFDDAYTAPLHGFDSGQNYYDQCSSRQFLQHIRIPTLILHSKDDPFMTPDVIPDVSELSEMVNLELSDHGGHVGFLARNPLASHGWLENRIVSFISPCLIQT